MNFRPLTARAVSHFTLLVVLCGHSLLWAQQSTVPMFDLVTPVDIPIYLSGNFAELRANHFHTGIDIKTQGRIGIPVKCVTDGYISRINISPTGYGYALYIDHPQEGITTVYGHLDRFNALLDSVSKHYQYAEESFRIDQYFEPNQLSVKRGEVIAYSGNSGSSGGPHLHFEIRDTESEQPINPLYVYASKVKDHRPPQISQISLYPIAGSVAGGTKSRHVAVAGTKLQSPLPTAWGKVALGIKAYDYMDEVSNIFGVYSLTLKVDGDTLFSTVLDRSSFDEGRYLNSFIDYDYFATHRSFIMRSYIEPGNHLSHLYQKVKERGIIEIDEERAYHCQYLLSDIEGNSTTLEFAIQGRRVATQLEVATEVDNLLYYHLPHSIERDPFVLELPVGTLYSNLAFHSTTVESPNYYSPICKIATPNVPLHKGAKLTLKIENDTLVDKRHYFLSLISGKRTYAVMGEYGADATYTAQIATFGQYAVGVDKTPPNIIPIGRDKWRQTAQVRFAISDGASGIDSYRGEIDGHFALFAYDAKTGVICCQLRDKQIPKKSQHTLLLRVTDKCGNERVYETKF